MSTKLRPQQLRVKLDSDKGIQFRKDDGDILVTTGDCGEATLHKVLRAIIEEMRAMLYGCLPLRVQMRSSHLSSASCS